MKNRKEVKGHFKIKKQIRSQTWSKNKGKATLRGGIHRCDSADGWTWWHCACTSMFLEEPNHSFSLSLCFSFCFSQNVA